MTAAAGIDAWIHAAEPYVSKNANTITDALSLEAVRIITRCWAPRWRMKIIRKPVTGWPWAASSRIGA